MASKTARQAIAELELQNGIEAAGDILWRYHKTTDYPEGGISDEVIKAVAWALSAFKYHDAFMDGLLETLKLKWEEQPMGGFSLVRK